MPYSIADIYAELQLYLSNKQPHPQCIETHTHTHITTTTTTNTSRNWYDLGCSLNYMCWWNTGDVQSKYLPSWSGMLFCHGQGWSVDSSHLIVKVFFPVFLCVCVCVWERGLGECAITQKEKKTDQKRKKTHPPPKKKKKERGKKGMMN